MIQEAEVDISIRDLPELRTAAFAHKGPYYEIGKTFGMMFHWAAANGLLQAPPANADAKNGIAIYYDNPMVTAPEELRSDACVVVPADFEITGSGVRELFIAPGSYAETTFTGPYSELGEAWQDFMSHGLPQSSHQPDYDRPCLEIYLDDCNVVPAEQLRTQLLVPVKEAS
jgi:AraC family transcriptional regulator